MNCLTILRAIRRSIVLTIPESQFLLKQSFNFSSECRNEMPKTALVFLAPGFEEIEFTTAVDVLRRGGVDVTVAGTTGQDPICGSRNILISPDKDLGTIEGTYDAMVLPGGLGCMKAMSMCARIGELLEEQEKCDKLIAAICAAPVALKAHGIGKGKNLTSYPSMQKEMEASGDYYYKTDEVVVDCNLITSRGPATAMKFALTILKVLTSEEKAGEVAKGMLCI